MSQLSLFRPNRDVPVNVSKVAQRSPFRYPGGKTWLVPWIREWMLSLESKPTTMIEPFAGGGIASLTVAFEKLADHVLMVELDDEVAAVWSTILGRYGIWLAREIERFDLTIDSARDTIRQKPRSLRRKAFQTILRNRIYHGGILADGSGMLKHGENGRGIHSRWYPKTISKRIRDIAAIRKRLSFIEGDGMQVIEANLRRHDVAFFIDPPYTAGGKRAGRRLYRFNQLDHERLFHYAKKAQGAVLLTYDDSEEVRKLACAYHMEVETVAMNNTHHNNMRELLISKSLDWLRA